VRTYIEQTIAAAREQGWVQTLLGRRRYLPEIHSGNRNVREAAERAAINMPIQGTSADIMKLAMIDVYRYLRRSGAPCTLLLQVHDELVFGIQEAALLEIGREIVHLMENAYKLDVPIRVDAKLGPNWAEMQPLSIIHG
jgi:DNA polymerase-1